METVGKTLVSLVKKEHPDNGHPRIIFDDERVEFWKGEIGTYSIYDKEFKAMKSHATSLLSTSVAVYDIYDGIRLLNICRKVLDVVQYCGLTYLLTGEEKYAERAAKELDAAASFPDWNPYHFLDIGEMSCAFGLGYDWLYDYLSDARKAKYREKIIAYAFNPAMEDFTNKAGRKRSYKWYQDNPGDNWKLVCNGGLGIAALAICDEVSTDICEKVLYYGFKCNHKFIRDAYLKLDGSYVESLGYWEFATEYLGMYSTALTTACGTNLDLTDWEGLEKTGYFPIMLSSNRNYSFNFGDASVSYTVTPPLLFLGHEFGKSDIGYFRYNVIKNENYSIYDMFWLYPEDNYDKVKISNDYGSLKATNATFRTGWNKSDMFCGIHFGKVDVPHGHSDTGTFIIEYNNVRFFDDLGSDDYNLPNYSKCYRHITEGHNTLTMNPKLTLAVGGQKTTGECYISQYKSSDKESFAVCDMTNTYFCTSVKRGMKLLKETKTVIIQDELKCSASTDTYWYGHTKAKIDIAADGKSAKLTLNGTVLNAYILGADGVFTVTEAKSSEWAPKISGQAENTGYSRLTVNLKGGTEYTLSIAFVPEGQPVPTGITALADWN
ncbi:MAG: heparinase II/III family protein [Firmicutes bacterium]|nr:heparinase II/III family protein [Candidatus Colimorpha enterica]